MKKSILTLTLTLLIPMGVVISAKEVQFDTSSAASIQKKN